MMIKNDSELVNSTLSGGETAFTLLVQKYHKSIHAIVWRRIKDYHIAEEITQDVFLQAYNKLSTLKDPNKFGRWLYVITKQFCTKWLQLILDNGLTIENFMHYASCLSKRHILAFLEDNPDFQKVNFFGIPPIQDDWEKYKMAVVMDIIATEKEVREQDEQNHKDEVADSALKTALAHLKSCP